VVPQRLDIPFCPEPSARCSMCPTQPASGSSRDAGPLRCQLGAHAGQLYNWTYSATDTDIAVTKASAPRSVSPCKLVDQHASVCCHHQLVGLQVVMRIRPSMQHGIPSWSKENCIHAVSGSTVAIAPPESSQGYKNGDRGQTYNFTRVFNEHTAQEEYFQATAAPLVSGCISSVDLKSLSIQEQGLEEILLNEVCTCWPAAARCSEKVCIQN